jgi:benzoyl-CoA reductase/2-hydroxyglutaryl-CoA dehydratase subunit BcrC/BadD/HgdB
LIADIHLKEEGILRVIRQEKDLSKETEEKLKLYLENFLREFLESN